MTRTRTLLLAVAAAVAAILAVAVVRVADADQRRGAPSELSAPPEAVNQSEPYLALDAPSVAPRGLLGFVLRNPTSAEVLYGLGSAIDRWDGAGWRPAYLAEAVPETWNSEGKLVPAGQELPVRALGLVAPMHGDGQRQWVRLNGLRPGWYRLAVTATVPGSEAPGTPSPTPAHDGPTAYGIFQVTG
jgi:hypothetical protein